MRKINNMGSDTKTNKEITIHLEGIHSCRGWGTPYNLRESRERNYTHKTEVEYSEEQQLENKKTF